MSEREMPMRSMRATLDEFEGLHRALADACPALAENLLGLVEYYPYLKFYRPLHEALRLFVAAPGIAPLFQTFSYENADITLVSDEMARRGEEYFRLQTGLGYDPEHLDAHLELLRLPLEDRRPKSEEVHTSVRKAYSFFLRTLGFAMARWDEKEAAIELGLRDNVRRLQPKREAATDAEPSTPAKVIDLARARRRHQTSFVPNHSGVSDVV